MLPALLNKSLSGLVFYACALCGAQWLHIIPGEAFCGCAQVGPSYLEQVVQSGLSLSTAFISKLSHVCLSLTLISCTLQ